VSTGVSAKSPASIAFFPFSHLVRTYTRFGEISEVQIRDQGQKFKGKNATEAYFADLEKTYLSGGLKKLEHRWVKSIELKGDYVEK